MTDLHRLAKAYVEAKALEALRTSKTPNRAGGLTPKEFTR